MYIILDYRLNHFVDLLHNIKSSFELHKIKGPRLSTKPNFLVNSIHIFRHKQRRGHFVIGRVKHQNVEHFPLHPLYHIRVIHRYLRLLLNATVNRLWLVQGNDRVKLERTRYMREVRNFMGNLQNQMSLKLKLAENLPNKHVCIRIVKK